MKIKKPNIFTFLLTVCVFAFVLRLVDLASFSPQKSEAETTPPAKSFEAVQQPAEPVKMAANDTLAPTAATAASDTAAPATPAPAADATADQPAAAPPPPYGEQGFSASEVEVLQSLAKRRDELDKREQTIGQREALLKAASGEVDRKIAELNKIRNELEDLLNKQKTVEDERINSLVKIYENMKPKDAANIFNTLEMDVLLPVISKMKEQKTSPILAAMDPEKARQVTIKLAEQHKLPQLPDDKKKPASPGAPPPLQKQ